MPLRIARDPIGALVRCAAASCMFGFAVAMAAARPSYSGVRIAGNEAANIGPIGGGSREGHCTGGACPGVSYFVHVGCVWAANAHPRDVRLVLTLPSGPSTVMLRAATLENVQLQEARDKCQAAYDKQTGARSRMDAMRKAGAEIPPRMLQDLAAPPPGCPEPAKVDSDKPIEIFSRRTGMMGKSPSFETRLRVNGACVPRLSDIKSFTADFAEGK